MNKELIILGCSQLKKDTTGSLPAIDRYDGPAYKVLRSYLRTHTWPESLSVAILSAEHGLMGGFAGIEDYNNRMTLQTAIEKAPQCNSTLMEWSKSHRKVSFSLGKDYLKVVEQSIGILKHQNRAVVFDGGIGVKLGKIKNFLYELDTSPRRLPYITEAGSGKVTYFLPDWDDLLDGDFDFERGEFSSTLKSEREDKHCSVLMKPQRMCDGILVSLAQHVVSKGPLRRLDKTDPKTLSPLKLKEQFGLENDQYLFGDCGAFSYVNEEIPSMTVDQAIALYDLHGFDFGTSVDHIPMPFIESNGAKRILSKHERQNRIEITKENALEFIDKAKHRQVGFTPVGAVQGLDADGYVSMVKYYHEIGYRHMAIGGLVPLPDVVVDEIVTKVMTLVNKLTPRPWIHLFGVFRPKLQEKFRALKVDSFDSATYFRKAWLRSDQNYLATNGKWYAAIRVPMTSDGRTRKKLQLEGRDLESLEAQEANVMRLLCSYDRDEAGIKEVLDAVIDYDENLTRSGDTRSMISAYERTLTDRPWRNCPCQFCQNAGIHVLIFRGSNRNKRRGAHNTLMLYKSLDGK
jgi:hypothetical protein